MEGAVEWIFQDAAFAASRDSGWRLEGMRYLAEGDLLTITGDDGLRLFSRLIRKRKRHGIFGHRTVTPAQGGWYPAGVLLDDWIAWMNRKPPLSARLRPAPARASVNDPAHRP